MVLQTLLVTDFDLFKLGVYGIIIAWGLFI
jgi:hypothetical protein